LLEAYENQTDLFVNTLKTMETRFIHRHTSVVALTFGAAALLAAPTASPADTIFVSNFVNKNIVEFTSGGVGSVFASTGASNPSGMAFDSMGNMYVSYVNNNLIEKFSPSGTDLGVFASTEWPGWPGV
jgi:hypothetical protein